MTETLDRPTTAPLTDAVADRVATRRRYLMCRPTHFEVAYAINPWMDPSAPIDRGLALRQWETLRRTYLELGHEVALLDPLPGMPDMVFAANGQLSYRGRAIGARFAYPQRTDEASAHLGWLAANGALVAQASVTNEGEGDFLAAGDRILAGHGFRTDLAAHAEVAAELAADVVSLELVDPAYYHLDTCLGVLSDAGGTGEIAYLPTAFSPAAQATLRELYPTAITTTAADAAAFGLNLVSDNQNVVLPPGADTLAAQIRDRGFTVVEVDTSELIKSGGSVKCCTQELRLS